MFQLLTSSGIVVGVHSHRQLDAGPEKFVALARTGGVEPLDLRGLQVEPNRMRTIGGWFAKVCLASVLRPGCVGRAWLGTFFECGARIPHFARG
jgi:hypothetical protein